MHHNAAGADAKTAQSYNTRFNYCFATKIIKFHVVFSTLYRLPNNPQHGEHQILNQQYLYNNNHYLHHITIVMRKASSRFSTEILYTNVHHGSPSKNYLSCKENRTLTNATGMRMARHVSISHTSPVLPKVHSRRVH